jgi:drug/metabolite transporter (DMT)-like permease
VRTVLLTIAALLGFAANSLLCRAALAHNAIDPATFTLVRLSSGALVLWVLSRRRTVALTRDLISPIALFAYAILFSFAYVRLRTGPGALLLFGAVQLTMIMSGVRSGERPRPAVWLGLLLAIVGLAVLTIPSRNGIITDPIGAILMASAGVAWGVYSLRGRGAKEPLRTTAKNFALAAPISLVTMLLFLRGAHASPRGVGLAIASGALASGVGYTLWYAALPSLTATRAAIVQLAVPVLAAAAGVIILGEALTTRVIVAGSTILIGIAVSVRARAT